MKGPRTIDCLALCEIIIILAGEKTVSISSYYSLNVTASISTRDSEMSFQDVIHTRHLR